MDLIASLRDVTSIDRVRIDADDIAFFSEDLFSEATPTQIAAIVSPWSTDELSEIVQLAEKHKLAIVARGGGMSYTGGYRLDDRAGLVVDVRGLDRVREVNARDRFMIVECGATWKQVSDALMGTDLRPALRGPISGAVSTLGGALSQNLPGSMDGVLGLEVVSGDGVPFWTGSNAAVGRSAFYRNFGPDLTGVFLGDAGTLGIKSAVALKLESVPSCVSHASFGFDSMGAVSKAMTDITALGLSGRVFALDPLKNKTVTKVGVREGLSTLGKVIATDGIKKGVVNAARIVAAGRSAYDTVKWSLHLSFEGITQRIANDLLAQAVTCCTKHGRSIEPSIPIAMRSRPFSVRGFLGMKGERWAPMHGIFPISRVEELIPAVETFFEKHADELRSQDIVHSYMLSANPGFFLMEPMFYWPDRQLALHERYLSKRQLERLTPFDDNPEARRIVADKRSELRQLFALHGAVATQLGRFYPYRGDLHPASRAVFDQIKCALDPNNLFNPGALGTEKNRLL